VTTGWALALLAALGACNNTAPNADELADDLTALVAVYQPVVDGLVERVHHLKRDIKGNMVDWEMAFREAQLASDGLGLPPFEQATAPGPDFRPSPGSLIGMPIYIHDAVPALVAKGDTAQLARILADANRKYILGIVRVSHYIDDVDYWLAHPGPFRPFQRG
jgi:hypothetical protein